MKPQAIRTGARLRLAGDGALDAGLLMVADTFPGLSAEISTIGRGCHSLTIR